MTKENVIEKEQIKILKHYISELTKYIEETATILDINTSATILGKNCIEYWAVLSSASNNAIKKLQQENEELKQFQEDAEKVLKTILDNFNQMEDNYRKALEEIENVSKKGLNSICYKSNCSRCQCYDSDDCNAGMNSLVNKYFTENSEFVDENSDFIETLEALIESERKKCNKAIPIAQQVLDIINKIKGEQNDR